MVFIMSYAVYLVWMINAEDLWSGLNELKLKLPLLVLPLVTGFSFPLRKREILLFFIVGTVLSSLTGTVMNAGKVFSGSADARLLSPFISHIRLSLMAVFALFASFAIYFNEQKNKYSLLLLLSGLWLAVYLACFFPSPEFLPLLPP